MYLRMYIHLYIHAHPSHPLIWPQPDMRRLKQKIKGVLERKLGSGDQAHPLLKSSR